MSKQFDLERRNW